MSQSEIKLKKIQGFSYSLGVIVLWILGRQIRENGIAYLACGLEFFYLLTIPMGAAFTDVLSRILHVKNAKEQYKDAERIRGKVIKIQLIVGIVMTVILALTAGFLADKVIKVSYVRYVMWILAPALLFRSITGALQGCLRGENAGIAAVAASYLRQILLLVFGLIFTGSFTGYGEKVSRLLLQKHLIEMYGAMGVALAITCSELVVSIFLVIVYRICRKQFYRVDEGLRTATASGTLTRGVYIATLLPMLCRFLVFLPMPAGMILYRLNISGDPIELGIYGALAGSVFLTYCFALFPLMAMLGTYEAKAEARRRREGGKTPRSVFLNGLHAAMTHAFYVAGFCIGGAFMIVTLLVPHYSERATSMLQLGGVLMIFLVFALYCTSMLMIAGKEKFAIVGPALFAVVFIVVCALLCKSSAGVFMILYAGLAGGLVFMIWSGFWAFRAYRSTFNHVGMLVVPLGAAILAGLICFGISKLLAPHIGVVIGLILSFVLSFALYGGAILVTRNFKENELRDLMAGDLILMLGRKIGIY